MSDFDQSRSRALLERSCALIPGGVNSPVRAFASAHHSPPFIERGEGAELIDVDGHRFIDYVGSWGPLLLGHAHPKVVEAICEAAGRGSSFGAPTAQELEFAEKLVSMVPTLEMVRLVNSGTEATMSAVRLARGATGRDRFIKFIGCYHGHGDAFLIQAGSGLATHGSPSSPGVPVATAADTLLAPYNDLAATAKLFEEHGKEIAAIIVEPVAGNMGCVPPEPGFLEGLRKLCDEHGSLLIFDEVMTGFRVGAKSAVGRFGIQPDLLCLGKIIGGGLPLAAYGGQRKWMEKISPAGPIYQAGTLSGNPLAVAAGLATLKILEADPEIFDRVEEQTNKLALVFESLAAEVGYSLRVQRVGSMGCAYFTDRPVRNFEEAAACDADLFYRFHAEMLKQGVYLAPSPFEAFFVGAAHDDAILSRTFEAANESFATLWSEDGNP